MKKSIITATALCAALIVIPSTHAENTAAATSKKTTLAQTTTEAKKQDVATTTVTDKMTNRSVSTADFLDNADIKIDATIGFIESFTIMGECEEGKKARQDIEAKRNLATQDIQEESKKFEKAKSDYIAKSTTMSDAARERAEKDLMKKERDIKNLVAEKEEELKLDMQLATETLAQGLEAGVAKLAKNENLDVVFDKMTGRAIYVSEKFDYTSQAIREVNKTYEVKLAQSKKAEAATKVAENKAVAAKPAKVEA